MSTDDIQFDEVRYREPSREMRPDRDGRLACIAYGIPAEGDLPIFLDFGSADLLERHALRDTKVELGGILLGRECLDERTGRPFVRITQALEAKHYENTQASFTYTHDAWEEITRERDRLHPDLDIVGWYHTHPDFGVFLSGHDQFLHRHFFGQPLQVAYVIDPIRQERGFFRLRDEAFEELGGFQMTSDRGDRLALARFVNDLEAIPNAGPAGGGGGLSPRLEAQLMAMLARPTYPAADRGQAAAAFGLLGVALGVLGLAAVLWLNTLGQAQRDQTQAIQDLRASMERTKSDRDLERDADRFEAKEAALDILLREVRAGSAPGRFPELYAEALRDRDAARGELQQQRVAHNAVYEVNARLTADLKTARGNLAALEKKATRADDLGAKVEDLEAKLKARDHLDAASPLGRKYEIAWYVAAGGGTACILLLLGLVAALARPTSAAETEDEPPHQIPA